MEKKIDSRMLFFVGFALIFVFVGLLILIFGIKLRNACSVQTEAVVADFEIHSDSHEISYCPIVEFYVKGKIVHTESKVTVKGNSGMKPPYQIGEKILVKYNPNNPQQIMIEGYDSNFLIYIGGIFLIIGVMMPYVVSKFH